MIKLDLKTDTLEDDLLKTYLEENASPTLASKIQNGVKIQKDGKTLINKKDLEGFMAFACEEARKITAKGKTGAAIKDDIVYGWLIHYFEEDSIIGKLYNEDGTAYQPPKKQAPKTSQRTPAPTVQAKPAPEKPKQFTLFDMITENSANVKPPVEKTVEPVVEAEEPEEDYIVDEETGEILSKEPIEKPTVNQTYQRYLKCMNITPNAVIAMRLGDFYEIYGDHAVDIANKVGLMLTSRDFGLPERIPTIGIPFHAADAYFYKITNYYNIMIVENEKSESVSKFLPCTSVNGSNFDDDDEDEDEFSEEEMREFDGDFDENITADDKPEKIDDYEDMKAKVKAFDQDALLLITEIIGDELIISEEDI